MEKNKMKLVVVVFVLLVSLASIITMAFFFTQQKNVSSKVNSALIDSNSFKSSDNVAVTPVSSGMQTGENFSDCTQVYNDLFEKAERDFQKCGVFAEKISCESSPNQKTQTKNNVMVIFDSSGSMAGKINGRTKIDIAKEATWKFLNDLNGSDVSLGILVYGHKGSNSASQKDLSCSSIEEIYRFGELNSQVAKDRINQFKPTGWTPIASSLEKAAEILSNNSKQGDRNSILLISDGEETCGGNPITKAAEIKNSKGIVVNVVAFDVTGDEEAQLKKISQSGGGSFYSAHSLEDMFAALAQEKEKYWQKYECESQQWKEWLDKNMDLKFIGYECTSDLHWEQWHMVDMGANMINGLPETCKSSIADTYRKSRYTLIRERLIENYIFNFVKVNRTMNSQDIWTSNLDKEELRNNLKSFWNHSWDEDLNWNWIDQEIQKAELSVGG